MSAGKLNYHGRQLNSDCTACALHEGCNAVCLNGVNTGRQCKLMIFSDMPDFLADRTRHPFAEDTGEFLNWLLDCMSVPREEVAFDYVLRCYTKKLPGKRVDRDMLTMECNQYRFATIAKVKPKVIVTSGDVSLEVFTNKCRAGEFAGLTVPVWEPIVKRHVPHVWVMYSLAYALLGDPSESVNMFRTIFMAAKEAGLKPKINNKVKPFIWKPRK